MTQKVGAPRFTPYALGIFAFALALRAFHLWQLRASPFLAAKLGDAATYDAWARQIAGGDWLGSDVFVQAPLYPYLLGALYAGVGDDPLLVRGVQCVLSALACAFLASAGARLFSRGAGVAAGLLLATYAPSIFLDALIQKSVLDVFFLCLALWLAARVSGGPRGGLAAALGVATGALALARENALVLAAVFVVWLLLLPGLPQRRRVVLALAFAAGLAGPLVPVAFRNWWVGGEAHLTSSQFGFNFYVGNHPGAPGGYEPLVPGHGVEHERQDLVELAERGAGRPLSPAEVSAYWTRLALDYITSQPADWLRLMARKVALLLSTVELVDTEDQYATADYSSVLRAAGWLGHFGVLAPLAVLGAFVTWPRRRELWWIHAAVAAYAASVVLFYVFARYRYPLVPFLALLAGAGLVGVRAWLASRSRLEIASCAVLMLTLAGFANLVSPMSRASMRAVTYFNLGNTSREAGHAELAAGYYRKALDFDPHLTDAANGLADSLLTLGRPDEAIAVYERSLAENPADARLHANLGAIFRARRESARALEQYQRAVELDPEYAVARDALGGLHLELAAAGIRSGDETAALAHYRSVLALRPQTPAAMWGAAWILATSRDAALRRPAEAVALAERATALVPRLGPSMLETLAAAYAAEGRFEPALARAREALASYAAAGQPPPPRLTLALRLYERGEPLQMPAQGGRG
jgi:tetratricopeptide (TPR) repeat protein